MDRIENWSGGPLATVRAGTPLNIAARQMVDDDVRHLPVVRADQRCVGMLTDMAVFAEGNWFGGRWVQRRDVDVAGVMEPIRLEVRPSEAVVSVLASMRRLQVDHALVVSEGDVPVGVFTEHDAVAYGARHLPADVAVPQPRQLFCAGPDTTVLRALSAMLEWNVRHLLVIRDKRLLGVVSVRDLVVRPGSWTVQQAMPAGPTHHVASGASLREAAAVMEHHHIGSLPIVDGTRPLGIVTRTDVVDALIEGSESETPTSS